MAKNDKIEVKDYPIVKEKFGCEVPYCETWTDNEELNVQVTETLGYVPLDKQVERLIEAGESLIVTRLREGTYSNDEGDEEFHDNYVDDLSMKSYDELVKLQRETADNFYIKKAALSHMIKAKKANEELSMNGVEKASEGSTEGREEASDASRVVDNS